MPFPYHFEIIKQRDGISLNEAFVDLEGVGFIHSSY